MPPINSPAEHARQNLALLAAAKTGDAKALSAALASGAQVDSRDSDGRASLMLAAKCGSNACLQTLIAAMRAVESRHRHLASFVDAAPASRAQAIAESTLPMDPWHSPPRSPRI